MFVTKWGSSGSGNGQFGRPHGIAVASDGSVYVADRDNHRVQKFTSEGVFVKKWGGPGGAHEDGKFNCGGCGVAVGPDGSVYVADSQHHLIQKFTAEGVFITKWPEQPPNNCPGCPGSGDAEFYSAEGVAVASDGTVYIADLDNNRIQKLTSEGVFVIKWGSLGDGDSQFNLPSGIAVAPDGSVYVTGRGNNRIQKFSVGP